MYTTYFTASGSQARHNVWRHESILVALVAWEGNCDTLPAGGGESILEDEDGIALAWVQDASGGHARGRLIDDIEGLEPAECDTPAKAARIVGE